MFSHGRSPRIQLSAVLVLLLATGAAAQNKPKSAAPAPRWPDGTINLGAPPGDTGKWEGGEPLVTDPNNYEAALGRRLRPDRIHINDVPLQPWARALVA